METPDSRSYRKTQLSEKDVILWVLREIYQPNEINLELRCITYEKAIIISIFIILSKVNNQSRTWKVKCRIIISKNEKSVINGEESSSLEFNREDGRDQRVD